MALQSRPFPSPTEATVYPAQNNKYVSSTIVRFKGYEVKRLFKNAKDGKKLNSKLYSLPLLTNIKLPERSYVKTSSIKAIWKFKKLYYIMCISSDKGQNVDSLT